MGNAQCAEGQFTPTRLTCLVAALVRRLATQAGGKHAVRFHVYFFAASRGDQRTCHSARVLEFDVRIENTNSESRSLLAKDSVAPFGKAFRRIIVGGTRQPSRDDAAGIHASPGRADAASTPAPDPFSCGTCEWLLWRTSEDRSGSKADLQSIACYRPTKVGRAISPYGSFDSEITGLALH